MSEANTSPQLELLGAIDTKITSAVLAGKVTMSTVVPDREGYPRTGYTPYDVNSDLELWTTKSGFRYLFQRYPNPKASSDGYDQRELVFQFWPNEDNTYDVFAYDSVKIPDPNEWPKQDHRRLTHDEQTRKASELLLVLGEY